MRTLAEALAGDDDIGKQLCGILRPDKDGKVRAVISPGRIAVTLGYYLSKWSDQQRDRRGEQPFEARERQGLHMLLLSDDGLTRLAKVGA